MNSLKLYAKATAPNKAFTKIISAADPADEDDTTIYTRLRAKN